MTDMEITPIRPHVGAEVHGVDLSRPVSPETRERLNEALVDHVALVIRNQRFGPAEFLAAVSLFGEPMEDQNRRHVVEDVPLVSVLSNRHTDSRGKPAKVAANATWHTDHTNQACPPKVTCLYPVALPDSGGGTSVCNMRAAWEALPRDWQARIADMQTENTLISSARAATGNPDVVADQRTAGGTPMLHPLVRTHPERGTRAIWFHQNKTERVTGLDPAETQKFLDELLEVAIRTEFTYTHSYRLGDMLLVDNRSAMHRAGFDYDHSQHRMLYRALVRGDRPF